MNLGNGNEWPDKITAENRWKLEDEAAKKAAGQDSNSIKCHSTPKLNGIIKA